MTQSVCVSFSWERNREDSEQSQKVEGKIKKVLKTVFETQNTRFSRLKQVARASHQNTQSQNYEKISNCFSRLEGLPTRESRAEPQKSMYPPRLDLSLVNKSPKSTRELAAVACDLDDPRLSRQNRATLFLNSFSFCKNKVLSKNT